MEKSDSQLKFNSDGSLQIPDSIKRDLSKRPELDIWEDNSFSDETFNLEDDVRGFNLYKDGKRLNPLKFSNEKTQEDVVNEVVSLINKGKKVIFIKGVCGTGKSAIALNIAKELGSASIVVPGRALQKQYYDDYSKQSYVLKNDHKKLKIKVITGRQNHNCLYLRGESADFSELPCKIEIKESNFEKLKEYLKENPKVKNDLELKDIRRMSVAPVCPYWSPIIPSEYDFPFKSDKKRYLGLNGIDFTIHNRKQGCGYYGQFNSYADAEAIIFNSAKYKFETAMNRKPQTKVEIIDECDEFLDTFSNVRKFNLTRLLNTLNNTFVDTADEEYILQKFRKIVSKIFYNPDVKESLGEIFKLEDTETYELFSVFLNNGGWVKSLDEDSYVQFVYEIISEFSSLLKDSFICFSQEERGLNLSVVSTNLAQKFKELLDKSESIVLMSGTIHSEGVLKYVFGLDDFEIIDAEVINQGEVEVIETGLEKDCKYSNFQNGNNSREEYLKALDLAVEKSVKPVLIHVNSFEDLPSENEKSRYFLSNLITKEKLYLLQNNFNSNFEKFKKKEEDVLFTTRCNRGVDFPKDQCNSIIFTKYPNPHVDSLFWKLLKQTHPQQYWTVYKDKARREFLQKIYRGVRSYDDHVYILSPDKRIIDAVKEFLN
jgi:Rad3-related DNA helicase